jgi:hypothetical protein
MANRLVARGPSPYVAFGRLLVALIAIAAVVVGASFDPEESRDEPQDPLAAEASRLRATTEKLSAQLGEGQAPDLAMAWEDMRNDLLSVASDLERSRLSMDTEGLISRVESFREQFDMDDEVVERWDELVQVLNVLAERQQP